MGFQSFEWDSFNFLGISFNFQVLTRTAVQITRVTDSNCAKGGSKIKNRPRGGQVKRKNVLLLRAAPQSQDAVTHDLEIWSNSVFDHGTNPAL